MSSPIIDTPPKSHEVRVESNVAGSGEDHVVANEIVLILDAGSQYSKVIDRRVRELCVASEIHPFDTKLAPLLARGNVRAIIISGGPESVYSAKAPAYDPFLFDPSLGVPVLGICYGMQLMTHLLGGKVEKKDHREDGVHNIHIKGNSELFYGLEKSERVLLTHGDSVTQVAPGFTEICLSEGGVIAGVENVASGMYGLQFHPEVDLTENGKSILKNFLLRIAKCKADYTLDDREHQAIKYIRETVGDGKVLVLVSGGVDSTVCAALIAKAIGPERVIALHIDNGFMRHEESARVEQALKVLGLRLIVVDASQTFYNSTTTIKGVVTEQLKITVHPEEKRKIIGDTFMKVADDEVRKLGLNPNEVYLAQGTLRPDLIESSSKTVSGVADVIKTHHNDTELVRLLRETGRVVEPLRDYHKDEVRELGKNLGLSEDLVWRQPFPGPGLAIRILCSDKPYVDAQFDTTREVLSYIVTGNAADTLDQATRGKIDAQLRDMSCYEKVRAISGITPLLLPVQTVGVQGDGRTYSYLVGLTQQTPNWTELFQLAKIIPKLCHNVNRVVYVFGEPVANPVIRSITTTRLQPDTISQLQIADAIANEILQKYKLIRTLSQVPIILFPIDFDTENSGKRSIAIRTFITNDFMTGVPAVPNQQIPEECLREMVDAILAKTPNISRVVFDLTSKPPGTTEWE
ncbi:GMP synthetase [Heterostelium album PN500]|uniref:GMP synthase (glutamine-hydrolyzing) n=1 Tax=Heterostelium pallidum (strain ATCC 26659 / Pp 5 / PN500) TaxID=670386 RepID=D3BSA3_HETP5|nr:GMP synthetase [Heterostelium album PN500]EFA75840.1 GMP synthetase [Heterostelium album PN500]|eukprot:XP_020427974.1 GMP synthetase [Heterostelium album PN500]